jgi:hypothetical protein
MEKRLIEFVRKWDKVVQRSPEWYKLVGETIGLSEMASLFGKNDYKKYEALINEKVLAKRGIFTKVDNDDVKWGKMFEEVITQYTEAYFVAKVVGDSICIRTYEHIRGSPDGYIMLRLYEPDSIGKNDLIGKLNNDLFIMKNGKKYQIYTYVEDQNISNPVDNYIEEPVLLEFKCPFSRIVGPLKDIYKYQVLGGISLSEEAGVERGLFVDAKFKKCELKDMQFDNTDYDEEYPPKKYGKYSEHRSYPIAMGIIYVYDKEIPSQPDKLIDYGHSSVNFSELLEKIDNGTYKTILGDTYMPKLYKDQIDIPIGLQDKLINSTCIGFIPYKLMHVWYTLVEKDKYFLDEMIHKVDKAIAEVISISSASIL